MSRRVYVNEAFRPQRVSGQQRYAREISDRLSAGAEPVAPGAFWGASRLRTWLWVQTILPLRTWRGVLVSLTARAPLWHPRHLLVVHDLFVLEHPEWFSTKFQLTHRPLLRFQLATARCLVAVSEPIAAQLRTRQGVGAIVVAPNAPSAVFGTGVGPGTDGSVLEDYRLTARRYLMVVGSMDPRKNLRTLALAYGRLSAVQRADMPLVVVGGEADAFKASAVSWPSGTVVTGYIDDAALRCLYTHCRAVVFPSLAEGFGLPLVEAVVAGAPRLLVSDIPVFRWICGDGARYVDAESVDDLAAALAPDQIDRMPAPDNAAISRFDWSRSSATIGEAADRVAYAG